MSDVDQTFGTDLHASTIHKIVGNDLHHGDRA